MQDPAEILVPLIAVMSVVVVLLVLGVSSRTTGVLEFMLGATAGLQAVQVGGRVHAFTLVCVLYLLIGTRPSQPRSGRSIALLVSLMFLLSSVAFGSLVVSIAPAIQLTALALGAVLIAMRATEEATRNILYGLLATCVLAALVALAQRSGLLSYDPLITDGFQRPKGIYTEPDWLGLFSAVGLIIAYRVPLRAHVRAAIFVILSATLILAFARAAWVGLGIVIVIAASHALWSLIVRRRSGIRLQQSLGIVVAMACIAGGAVLAFYPNLIPTIEQRLTTAGAATDPSTERRRGQYEALVRFAGDAPWHGYGLSAAGRVNVLGITTYGSVLEVSDVATASDEGPSVVATNWVLGWWADAKYLALPLIVALIVLAIATLGTTSGLLLTLVLVHSLISNVVLLPVTWLLVGLALAEAPAWERRRARAPGPVTQRNDFGWLEPVRGVAEF